ncbi:MAG: radical SAM protein [bacterium]
MTGLEEFGSINIMQTREKIMIMETINDKKPRNIISQRRSPVFDAVAFLRSYFSIQPSYLIFFVTANCNARCPHCFYRTEIEAANTSKELKLEEITKIAKSLNPLIYLSLAGGEPFLRPDLVEVVEMFYFQSGIQYCNIVTNGFYAERIVKTAQMILKQCPSLKLKIQVSIDDFEPAHDENRGVPGIYQNAIKTVRRLSAEIQDHGSRLTVDIATCFTKSNKTRIVKIHDHLRRELKFDNYQLLYPRGNAKDKEVKEVTPKEYKAVVELIEHKKKT